MKILQSLIKISNFLVSILKKKIGMRKFEVSRAFDFFLLTVFLIFFHTTKIVEHTLYGENAEHRQQKELSKINGKL